MTFLPSPPKIFRKIFMPDLEKVGAWTVYGACRLDSPAYMKHQLDVLLEADRIKALVFTPGTGVVLTLSNKEYIPLYRKILARGKRRYLLAQPMNRSHCAACCPEKAVSLRLRQQLVTTGQMVEIMYCWSR